MTVRGSGFASLQTTADALDILVKHVTTPAQSETIPTWKALGRRLSEAVYASRDQPGFRRAAMDGFAIKAEDSFGATDAKPKQFTVIATVEIGEQTTPEIRHGQALRISTGAPLPNSATGVVKIEDAEVRGDTVDVYSAIARGKNVAAKDEDLKEGELVIPEGTVLRPWDIGILESLTIPEINVYRRPRVATLSTGNELVPSSGPVERGQVVDSNRPALNSWITELGAELVETDQCEDTVNAITAQLEKMAPISDLVVTTGGTSVGTKDYMAEVVEQMGDVWVHGIAVRPGKPVVLGTIDHDTGSTPIIALPGYPLAAFIDFHLFAATILQRWTGHDGLMSKRTTVTLVEKVASKVGTRDFVRLRRTEAGAEVIRITGAGILSSLVQADYLLDVPVDLEGYNAGEEVEVVKLR